MFSSAPVQTTDGPKQIPFTVATPGEKLTLTCPNLGDKPGLFYWYKMKSGHMFQTVATGTIDQLSLQGQFNNSRFLVTKGVSLYYLNIKNVSKEDEATYICQAGPAYSLQFISGTIVAVNGKVRLFVLFFSKVVSTSKHHNLTYLVLWTSQILKMSRNHFGRMKKLKLKQVCLFCFF